MAGRSVGRMIVQPYEDGASQARPAGAPEHPHGGTAWLIAATSLITNHHVVNARSAIDGRDPARVTRTSPLRQPPPS